MSLQLINFDNLIPDELKLKYKNDNPLTIQHPSRTVIVGPSGCGKTTLVLNLLLNKEVKMNYNRIYIICKDTTEDKYQMVLKHFTKIENTIKKKTGDDIKLFTLSDKMEDIPDLDTQIDKNKSNIIIFDDLITVKNQKQIEDYFVRSRKKNVSCIYIAHSYFKIPRLMRLNTEYFFFFSIPSRRELNNLFLEFAGDVDTQRMFNYMVRESTKNKKFFMIDLNTIDGLRSLCSGYVLCPRQTNTLFTC